MKAVFYIRLLTLYNEQSFHIKTIGNNKIYKKYKTHTFEC